MKSFFKIVFASAIGFIFSMVMLTLFFIFLIVVGASMATSSGTKVAVEKNSILEINLSNNIPERIKADPFMEFSKIFNESNQNPGLFESVNLIKEAAKDSKIKGIYLSNAVTDEGWAKCEEIRNALLEFKKSKKFIYAYSEVYSQKGYYLASVSDSIFINKQGLLSFTGLVSNQMFLKGMFDKLGIDINLIKAGKYKSAGEMFSRSDMSEPNRHQITEYLTSLFKTFNTNISDSRKVSVEELTKMSAEGLIKFPSDAVHYKLIDKAVYYDQFLNSIKKAIGIKSTDAIKTISMGDYQTTIKKNTKGKSRIALIYAVGEINGGEGDETKIGSEKLSKAIREARLDDDIKAIVLRVNSPGGSAMASDVIWREVVLANKTKPVIASFGDVAASGGYYIGAPARKIFVQPNTITGSIGVFALLPNFTRFLNEKIGLHFNEVKTGPYADLGSPTRPMTEGEKALIQEFIDTTYMQFKQRVAWGRNMTVDQVDSIAQGRVWTGEAAIKIGLADNIGSLQDAINEAVKQAKLGNDYFIEVGPSFKKGIFDNFKNSPLAQEKLIKSALGEQYSIYKAIQSAKEKTGILMWYPTDFEVR